MRQVHALAWLLPIVLSLAAGSAGASCGSSSCPLDLHSLQSDTIGRLSLDLSFQYIDQDQPRIGGRKGHGGEVPSDHDEIRTINRLASLQLNYTLSNRFQIALTVPYVSRSHEHFDNETATREQWDFGALGDMAVQARVRLLSYEVLSHESGVPSSLWLSGGLKLPTGATREPGSSGEDAEVTIAPGTGSTDGLLGLTYQSGVALDTALAGELGHTTIIPLFIALTGRVNGRGTDEYRRGYEVQLNAGTEYPISSTLRLLGQVNLRLLAKDDVGRTNEDRDLTGGRFGYLSPGVRVMLGQRTSVYGFVQLPVYQHVNGLQLTSKANLLAGIRRSF